MTDWPGLLAPVITVAPLAALWLWVSLHLPHRDAPWRALLPGALLVAIGFQVLHEAVGHLLVPKLEKSTSLYGGLGATTTLLFFMYMIGTPRRRLTRSQQLALRGARAEARRSARLNAGEDDALHPICVMPGAACSSTIGGTSDSQITEERNEP